MGKIAAALVAAQGEMRAVGKDATNPHFRSRYATLDAIMDMVRPILAKHGLAVMQGTSHPDTTADGKLTSMAVETRIIHTSGEWVSSSVIMPVAKADPQGAGSAVTYGRRYGISALLAIVADDDDDGNAATAGSHSAPQNAAQGQRGASRPAVADVEPGKRLHDSVPTTPKPKPWDGSLTAALSQKMPFGRAKGTPLGDMADDALASSRDWMMATDPAKFAELIGKVDAVIRHRLGGEDIPDLNGSEDDDLPF
jgi:hypothetical protein